MPYLVSSIIAVVTAMIILLTRYEADDSAITAEIERYFIVIFFIFIFLKILIELIFSFNN